MEEENKTKKKKSFFKSKLFLFAISFMFVIAIVSAVLVTYLSDRTEVRIDVESPFEIRSLNEGQELPVYGNLSLENSIKLDVVGGDTYEVTFGFQALSNNAMDVIEQYVIGEDGTTCNDFVEIGWYTCTDDCTIWAGYNTLDLSESMQCDDSSGKVIINAPNHYDAGETNVNKLVLTLQPGALGDYSISSQVLIA